jgi:uncharacterized lipoprotein YmbA
MFRITLLCFLLASCSSVVADPAENLPAAPYLSAVAVDLKKVAAEAHLAEPVEVSEPIKSHLVVALAYLP